MIEDACQTGEELNVGGRVGCVGATLPRRRGGSRESVLTSSEGTSTCPEEHWASSTHAVAGPLCENKTSWSARNSLGGWKRLAFLILRSWTNKLPFGPSHENGKVPVPPCLLPFTSSATETRTLDLSTPETHPTTPNAIDGSTSTIMTTHQAPTHPTLAFTSAIQRTHQQPQSQHDHINKSTGRMV